MPLGPIGGMAQGLNEAINQYLGTAVKVQSDRANEQYKSDLEYTRQSKLKEEELTKQSALETYKLAQAGKIDPETAAKLHPKAAEAVKSFFTANNRYPTVDEFKTLNPADKEADKATKQQQFDDSKLVRFNSLLSGDKEFSALRTKRDNLENVGKLIDQIGAQNNAADKRQKMELALAQMRVLINQGVVPEGEVMQLLPKTFKGDFAAAKEYVTNHPEDADSQGFITRAKDFFARESGLQKTQAQRRVRELSLPLKDVLDRNPETAYNIFAGYGAAHPKYNPKGDYSEDAMNNSTKTEETSAGNSGQPVIHTYPSGKKAIFQNGKWEPYNG